MLSGERLEVASVVQRLQLVFYTPVQQADEVEPVQLELQTAVQIQQPLSVRHSPSGRDKTHTHAKLNLSGSSPRV